MKANPMNLVQLSACVLALVLTSGCATPKRGDPEFAPAMPVQANASIQNPDAIYQPGTALMLLEDIKARRVGDMITVTLREKTDAAKTADTGTTKSTSSEVSQPIIFGRDVTYKGEPVYSSLNSEHEFDGAGESSQSNSLTGSITVSVVEVLANGNLVVQGEKWININQGEEFIRLRGIVRPSDINADNSIASTRVANAQIQYSGNGVLNDTNSMGWLARFFNGPWMPF